MSARVTRYQIRDPEGRLVAVHVRRDLPDGKGFSWERPDGASGLNGLPISLLPLYGAELMKAWPPSDAVLLVEGEKAADALRAHGFRALGTVTGAASAPAIESLAVLSGRDVIQWPDADQAGQRHMATIARRLEGVAASVKVFEWADAPERGDAHDYLAAGFDSAERLRAKLVGAVPPKEWSRRCEPAATAKRAEGQARGRPIQGKGLDLVDSEPDANPVDGQELFADIAGTLGRYIVLPPGTDVTIVLWVALTYLTDVVEVLPRLLLSSPTRECGKTRLLAIVGALVRRALPTASISPAALFRCIEAGEPTLILDEVDNARLDENPELRAILNSGHTRTSAWTVRTVGEQHEPRRFSTWAPVAFACIGNLPDTVASRCVRVAMRRRSPSERIARLRESRLAAELDPFRRRLARWTRDNATAIGEAEPQAPDALGDREADNWTPMLAIADAIGGEWPRQARQAALTLSGGNAMDGSAGEQVLADLRGAFGDADRVTTEDALRALVALEDRPWREWRADARPTAGGKPLTARGLAMLLKPFGIAPGTIKLKSEDGIPEHGRTAKGYLRDWFEDEWKRYLPPHSPSNASPASLGAIDAGQPMFSEASPTDLVTDGKAASDPLQTGLVTEVTDKCVTQRELKRNEAAPVPLDRVVEWFDGESVSDLPLPEEQEDLFGHG